MQERDYYPAGAYDDPNAPYNQSDNDPKEFECKATITLEADVLVETDQYQQYVDCEDGSTYYEFDGVDWEDEYSKSCISIPEMLNELKNYVESDLALAGKNTGRGRYLQRLLDACQGWKVVETEIEQS